MVVVLGVASDVVVADSLVSVWSCFLTSNVAATAAATRTITSMVTTNPRLTDGGFRRCALVESLSEAPLSTAISGLLRPIRGLSGRELLAIWRVQLLDQVVARHRFGLHVFLR